MAIESTNQNNQQAQQAAPSQQRQGGITDLFNTIRSYTGGAVATSSGGEYYKKMRDRVIELGKGLINDRLTLDVIGLNHHAQEFTFLKFSSLIVVLRDKDQPNFAAYHTLILEGTGSKLPPEQRLIDNMQTRINRVTSDAYDEQMNDLVYREVTGSFTNAQVLIAGAEVIPSTIQPESDMVESIVRNAAAACVTAIYEVAGVFPELSLATVGRDTRANIDMVVGQSAIYDTVGHPLRASVQVSMTLQKKDGRQRDPSVVNAPEDTIRVSEIVGFVNPIWAPRNQQSTWGPMGMQQMVPQGKLVAEFVITGINAPFANSTAGILLALSPMLTVVDSNNWIQALMPKGISSGGNVVDFNDIGALNVICNTANQKEKGGFGDPIAPETFAGDPIKTNQLIGLYFQPGSMVSIDCPESGAQSWYLNVLAAAAQGDQASIARIIDSMNELTNGQFDRFFKAGSPLFAHSTRVPLGYYVVNGQKRDIRDIDLTAICNIFKNNPENIAAYNDTFVDRPGSGPVTNLSKREGIISYALKEQCEITGYAQRVTLHPAFIEAFSLAVAAQAINTQINTPLSADQLRQGALAPDYVQGALVAPTNTFFNTAVGGFSRQPGWNTYHFAGGHR